MALFGSKWEFGKLGPFEYTVTMNVESQDFRFVTTIESTSSISVTDYDWPAIICSHTYMSEQIFDDRTRPRRTNLW